MLLCLWDANTLSTCSSTYEDWNEASQSFHSDGCVNIISSMSSLVTYK